MSEDADLGSFDTAAPPAATYRWAPAGVTCAACGERTERAWGDGEAVCCPDCKSWSV